ncbi:MAG: hypothetical protein IPM55_18220 [Acidobacteria bacterium]|nr:hypothetical protein [Acidobacteriota bacterium]
MQANTTATEPDAADGLPGATANFTTTASGTGPFSYAWKLDGMPIAGATNSNTIDTTALSLGAHTVEVTVTGACGAVTKTAALNVQASTAATELMPQTVCQGATANFTTTASGTGPFTYAWKLDGTTIAGATNSNTIDTTALSLGAHTVEVTVTGACGAVTKTAGSTCRRARSRRARRRRLPGSDGELTTRRRNRPVQPRLETGWNADRARPTATQSIRRP